MAQVTINVAANTDVKAKMSFTGVASYSAALYKPGSGPNTWDFVKELEDDGSSEDARPDEFTFAAPAAGQSLLFFFEGRMTTASGTGPVGATATFTQQGQSKGSAKESGQTQGTPESVVVRALLQGV
jgi:hypothetical protein